MYEQISFKNPIIPGLNPSTDQQKEHQPNVVWPRRFQCLTLIWSTLDTYFTASFSLFVCWYFMKNSFSNSITFPPLNPSRHSHWYELIKSWQFPPFWQGEDSHSFTSTEQLCPVSKGRARKLNDSVLLLLLKYTSEKMRLTSESWQTPANEASCILKSELRLSELRHRPIVLNV